MDKPWYENMRIDDLFGIHVRAKFYRGNIVEGRLAMDASNDDVCVIFLGYKGTPILERIVRQYREPFFRKNMHIESVDYIWDEKDYERIGLENIREGDYIVCNGILMKVDSIGGDTTIVKANRNDDLPDIEISKDLISEVLRYKQDLPDDPGVYKADNCACLILDSSKRWNVVEDNFNTKIYNSSDLPVKYRDNIRKAD